MEDGWVSGWIDELVADGWVSSWVNMLMEDAWEDGWLGKDKQMNLLVNGVSGDLVMEIVE